MTIIEDAWLAERFRHPVWTVKDEPAGAVLAHAAAHTGRALYQAKVPAEDVATLLELAGAGLVPVNLSVTLARETKPPLEGSGEAVEVREIRGQADAAVLEVAAQASTVSRFHLDPRVPKDVAAAIKRDWLGSYLSGARGEVAYVALADGCPVGFLAVLASTGVRTIDLIAVAEHARRAGAGSALLRRFVTDSFGCCTHLEVGTQGANVAATRFYEAAGFRAVRAAYDLHRLGG